MRLSPSYMNDFSLRDSQTFYLPPFLSIMWHFKSLKIFFYLIKFLVMNFLTWCLGRVVDKMSVSHSNLNHSYNLDLTSHVFGRNGSSKYALNDTIIEEKLDIPFLIAWEMLWKRCRHVCESQNVCPDAIGFISHT